MYGCYQENQELYHYHYNQTKHHSRKGVAYVKPFDSKLPLRPIEIEFENNRCCIEVHNTSNSTVEFLYGQEMAYFDTRSKGLVQINNSKHFPIDQ